MGSIYIFKPRSLPIYISVSVNYDNYYIKSDMITYTYISHTEQSFWERRGWVGGFKNSSFQKRHAKRQGAGCVVHYVF